MDKPRIGDDALTNLSKLFNIIGWDKKLNEITKDEILAVILIIQFSEKVEQNDKHKRQKLNELLLQYVKDYEKTSESIAGDDIPI
jgi:hypothetical protein